MNYELHLLRVMAKPDIFCQFYGVGYGGLIDEEAGVMSFKPQELL
jgi:hypothetical protein